MRRALLSLASLLTALLSLAQTDNAAPDPQPHKKVAVVLSGGGALGAIHVGALKVIEQAGLPVDMVVGTSMGSIIGALYSTGYNSDDVATMLHTTDWAELFLDRPDYDCLTLEEREARNTYIYERNFYVGKGIDPQPGGVIRGNRIEDLFERYLYGYTDSIDFLRDLPRQFACVATDLVDDTVVVLTRGSLVKSIRSSMSIPGVFTPVHMGDMVLVDGGAKNNFAADVARQLGADIVIGVKFDLGLGEDKDYRRLMDVMERSAGSDVSRRARENERYCDLLIKVPVRGYTSGSFSASAIDSLIARGERSTRAVMDSLLLLKTRAGVDASTHRDMHLRDVNHLPDTVPPHLVDTREDNTLHASVGLRFDTEDIAAAQLNGRYFKAGKVNRELDLTVRLGLRSMLRLDFDIEPKPYRKMGLSYELWFKNVDFYHKGKRSDNVSLLYQQVNAKLLTIDALNFDCELGVGWEHYHLFNELWNDNRTVTATRNEHYFNYHARLRYDNEDSKYFATRGVRAEARYGYYTDNMAGWKGHSGFHAVMAAARVTIPLSRTTHLRPALAGRLLFGDDLPATACNLAGGTSYGKFFPQQLPLIGLGHVEFFDTKLVTASLRVQQRVTGQHYLLLDGTVAEHNESMKRLFDNKPLWGVALSYFYNSKIAGPLGLSLGWNSHSHRLNVFLTLGHDF